MGVYQLKRARSLGKLEQVAAVCHHIGFFNNVGVSVHYKLPGPPMSIAKLEDLVYEALSDVLHKHPVLSVIPVDEDSPESYFAFLPAIHLEQSVLFLDRSQPTTDHGEDNELDAILQDQHNTDFKASYGTLPFWRLIILRDPGIEHDFTASFIFHHTIDGFSGLVFHDAFRSSLEAVSSRPSNGPKKIRVVFPDVGQLLPPLEQLHPLSINANPKKTSIKSLEEWKGSCISLPCKVQYRSRYLSPEASKCFIHDCKNRGLSVTSVLSSIITMTLFNALPAGIEALTCIVPVNLRPWLDLPHGVAEKSMGSYIDAFKVQTQRSKLGATEPDSESVWSGAEVVAKQIKEYLDNQSLSGEPYTAVAAFKNVQDVMPIFLSSLGHDRDAAIEVSNLGTVLGLENTQDNVKTLWHMGRATFSRSSVVSGSAITMSVVTGGDGSLSCGFSWQEGVIESEVVDRVLCGFTEFFTSYQ